MQSGGRYSIGRNEMVSIMNAGGTSVSVNRDEACNLNSGNQMTYMYGKSGVPAWDYETVNTFQPVDDGTEAHFTDPNDTSAYKGNNCIRAYNFIIEDPNSKLPIEAIDHSTDKFAVNLKTLRNVKDDLEQEIADIVSGGSGNLLTKTEAADTYETISNHTTDKQNLESAISNKANSSDVYLKSEVYSSEQSDATFLSKTQAQSDYATKVYVNDEFDSRSSTTNDHSIEAAYLSFDFPDGETTEYLEIFRLPISPAGSRITVNIECTITSNGTDITHDLDNYEFKLGDQTGPLFTMESIYEDESTKLYISYLCGEVTSSNNYLRLYVNRANSSGAESIVLTGLDGGYVGEVSQVTSGYITKAYADAHYASKDSPTSITINNYDYSTHTTEETVYDFGPDFTIKIGLQFGFGVGRRFRRPIVQLGMTALGGLLSFGLNHLFSPNQLGASGSYQHDIYNVIGLNQDAAFTDFNSWIRNYGDYSDATLDNFLISAAEAEARYLKSSSLNNYYTKSESDNKFVSKTELETDFYTKDDCDDTFVKKGDPVTYLNRNYEITLSGTRDFAISNSTTSTRIGTLTAENTKVKFDYRDVCAWNFDNRRPSSMDNVHISIKALVLGTGHSYTFGCDFSEYYSGILNDAHYTNFPCDYFFDISVSGSINCDVGDQIEFYFVTSATGAPSSGYVGSTEPATEDHPKYLKGNTVTTIDDYYTKAECDYKFETKSQLQADYYDKSDVDAVRSAIEAAADARYVQIANVGSLTLPSTINISYQTTGDNVIFESSTFMMDSNGLILHESRYGSGPQYAANLTFQNGLTYTGTVTITNETTNWKASNIIYMGFKFPTQSESQITFTRNGNVLSFTYTPDRDYTVEGFTFECDPRVTVSETSAGATMRLVQGTRTITVVDTLENYIRYIIANPQ